MFLAKLAASLALVAPLVSALEIETPTNWTSSDPASLTWTAANGDPQTFSIELINEQFNSQFALANNVPTGQLSISFTLPVVPVGGGFTVQFVNIGNLSDVFAETGSFSIGAAVSSSLSLSSASASSAPISSASASLTSASVGSTTSGFGTTQSATATSAAGTGSVASSGPGATGTSFGNGAVALGISNVNIASFAVMALAALGGARLVGF